MDEATARIAGYLAVARRLSTASVVETGDAAFALHPPFEAQDLRILRLRTELAPT